MTLQPIPLTHPRLNSCIRRPNSPPDEETYWNNNLIKKRVKFTKEGNPPLEFQCLTESNGERKGTEKTTEEDAP